MRRRKRRCYGERLETRALLAAGPGYIESFENGLSDDWSIPSIDGEGRVSIRNLVVDSLVEVDLSNQFTTDGNEYALVFDSSRESGDSLDDLAVALLDVDLSGAASALLTFHQLEGLRGDINHDLPVQHSLTTPGDGLAISQNGTDWFALTNVQGYNINRGGDGLWQFFEFDLVANVDRLNTESSAGINSSLPFQIKFSQYDDDVFPRRGWAIDNLRISTASPEFTTDLPRGVFHRFSLAGESESDFYFRAAVIGPVDSTTPVLVSTHGTGGDINYTGYSRTWHRLAAQRFSESDSLIVVAPAFVMTPDPGRFNQGTRYSSLSWDTADDAAADIALLEAISSVTDTGVGDGDSLRLWGFSAGGQFTGRFTAAHPEKVAAAVVGGPASQILPDPNVSYPYGLGDDPDLPPPEGVAFDQEAFLRNRIMYYVGQDDNDPNHSQLTRNATVDSVQGIHRLERSARQFRRMYETAGAAGLSSDEFEYQLMIAEGLGHGGWGRDAEIIYDFLFKESQEETPSRIYSRVVGLPSGQTEQDWLPSSIPEVQAGDEFYVEYWAELDGMDATSMRFEVFFDEENVSAVEVQHGYFSENTSGTIDNNAGRIRDVTGSASTSPNGVFSLLARVKYRANSDVSSPTEFLMTPQRSSSPYLMANDGTSRRTDVPPLPMLVINPSQTDRGAIQGVVFHDRDGDGVRGPNEAALAGREVSILVGPASGMHVQEFSLEPDDSFGSGAYLTSASTGVTVTSTGQNVANPGIRVGVRGADASSTGESTFAMNETTGFLQTQFVGDSRRLRMDFSYPTQSVSIDVVSIPSDSSDFGRLDVYNAQNQLLQSLTSNPLAFGQHQTLTIERQDSDIAWAEAYGVGDTVRLDNLNYKSVLTTLTDADGQFSFQEIAPAEYYIDVETESRESFTGSVRPDTPVLVSGGATGFAPIAINVPQVVVSPVGDLNIDEGQVINVEFTLNAEPTGPRTYSLVPDDEDQIELSRSIIEFDAENWNVPQVVQIAAVDDARLDGNVAVNIAVLENGVEQRSFEVVAIDNDEAGIQIVADPSPVVTEGGINQDIEVRLSSAPSSDVVLSVSVDATQVAVSASEITFTAANWDQPQRVSVSAVDDEIVDGLVDSLVRLMVIAQRSDDSFGDVPPQDLSVIVRDNEVAAFTVTETGNGSIVDENGSTDAVTVVLDFEPISEVVLQVQTDDPSEVSVNPTTLRFGPTNWNTPQSVAIIGVEDPAVDGNVSSALLVKIVPNESQDEFDALPDQVVQITTMDNDTAGFTVSESGTTTAVSESGSTDQVAVVLDAQPLSDVVLSIELTDPRLRSDITQLTFTAADWDQMQVIALSAVDNDLVDESELGTLRVSVDPALSNDAFDSAATQEVTVTIQDNDTAAFSAQVLDASPAHVRDDGAFEVVYMALDNEGNQDDGIKVSRVSVRLHFNSSEVLPDMGAISANAFAGATLQELQDLEDHDDDPATDRLVTLEWLDLEGQFPRNEQLPLSLFSAKFDSVDGFSGTSTINVSGIPPAGVDFQANPVVIDFGISNELPKITSIANVSVREGEVHVIEVVATDGNSDTISYSVSGGVDQYEFEIDSMTGTLRFASPPMYASPVDADGDNVYQVQVTAVDGFGGKATQEIEIEVTNASWTNLQDIYNVDARDGVSPLDALLVINELARISVHDPATGQLLPQRPEDAPFYDVTRDGKISPLDALLVINELASRLAQGELPGYETPRDDRPQATDRMITQIASVAESITRDESAQVVDVLASDIAQQWGRLF